MIQVITYPWSLISIHFLVEIYCQFHSGRNAIKELAIAQSLRLSKVFELGARRLLREKRLDLREGQFAIKELAKQVA